jgi:Polysaccharide biosynthesis protein
VEPIVLFGLQFTVSLGAYALLAWWYLAPRLARLPREVALVPLLWIHAFRIVGGTILAPGSVDATVPMDFRTMIGYGDMATAVLALLALVALRFRVRGAIALVWLVLAVGMLDTVNAIIQSMRDSVFTHSLGFNWVIVTAYVPALLVSSVLIFIHLRRAAQPAS